MTRHRRRLALIPELESDGWHRAVDLAGRFGVSTRTIYRDLAALQREGLPVMAVPGRGYRLQADFFLPPVTLTADEAVVLLQAMHVADRQKAITYQAAAESVRAKLRTGLPERLKEAVRRLETAWQLVPINLFDDPAELLGVEILNRALAERQVIRGKLRSGRAVELEPYGLSHAAGAWQLVGLDRSDRVVRHFRLADIVEFQLLGDTFERPPAYRQARVPEHTRGRITARVLFEHPAAHCVRQVPSPYVVSVDELGEGLILELQVDREAELLPWLLGWGAHARVLSPESLKRRLAAEAAAIADRYKGEPALLPMYG